jgi:L-malate glycosyltransferase
VRENVSLIEDYLQAADLGVFASETESFCLSILEAMCFGCPSVATGVGGIPELVGGPDAGWLVPMDDVDGLAEGVAALVRDRARRETMGSTGQRRAQELFSSAAIVPRYEALYRRVMGGTSGRR